MTPKQHFRARWIKTTIVEQFPVITNYPHHRGDDNPGPFYAPNSEWHTLYSERAMKHAEFSASYWRERGYTVTVEVQS